MRNLKLKRSGQIRVLDWLFILGTLLICLAPTGLFFLFYSLAGPVGFWQITVALGLGLVVCGSIQIAALICWSIFIDAAFK